MRFRKLIRELRKQAKKDEEELLTEADLQFIRELCQRKDLWGREDKADIQDSKEENDK